MREPSAARLLGSLGAPLGVVAERFELIEEAGAGGMGVVYRARDRATGGFVAVKVMSAEGDLERFGREARALAELVHPSIVGYVGHGHTSEGEPWLAMEWLEGDTLRRRISTEPLPIPDAIALGVTVAEGLAAAHAKGIVHRDLKPSNIFLVGGEIARAKILDFGVARLRDLDRELTRTGQVIGTPGYMAPEQARGTKQLDGRADLFSLGCVLFRCVAGRPPFEGDDVLTLLAELVLHHPPPLGSLAPGVPVDLERLVARLLAKSPAERPASAREVAVELSRIGEELREGRARIAGAAPRIARDREVILVVAQPAAGASRPDDEAVTTMRDRVQTLGGTLQELTGGVLVATIGVDGSDADRRVAQVEDIFARRLAGAHIAVSRAVEKRDSLSGLRAGAASPPPRRARLAVIGALIGALGIGASWAALRRPARAVPSTATPSAEPRAAVATKETARRACQTWARALEEGRREDGSYGIEKQRPTLGWSTAEALAAQSLAAQACEGATPAQITRTAEALRKLQSAAPWSEPGSAAFAVLGFAYAIPFVADAKDLATQARAMLLRFRDASGAFPFTKGGVGLESSIYGTVLALWALGALERAAPDPAATAAREDAERWLAVKLAAGAAIKARGLTEQALWVLLETRALPGHHAAPSSLLGALARRIVDHCDLDRAADPPACNAPSTASGALALTGEEANFSTLWLPWALAASVEAGRTDELERSTELDADLEAMAAHCLERAAAAGPSSAALPNYKISEQLMSLAYVLAKGEGR